MQCAMCSNRPRSRILFQQQSLVEKISCSCGLPAVYETLSPAHGDAHKVAHDPYLQMV